MNIFSANPPQRRAVCALLVLTLLAACRGGSSLPSRRTPVILISVDTLRSDRLPAYGYRGVSTPNLDAFRNDSILFSRAYANCPLTLPSHASMLTGRLPGDHGVRDNVGYRLADNVASVPDILKRNGYATGAAVSAYVLRAGSGLSRGFDWYDDEVEPVGTTAVIGRVQRDGRDTIAAAKRWLDGRAEEQPFFLFLHLYEPHTPYDPPEPYRSRYRDRYDGEVAYTDELLGDFFGYLRQRGWYDRALILFVSDHGEGLNDHGEEEHGIFLYREALQVPLIVKFPNSRRKGSVVESPVSLTDLAPTIVQQTASSESVGGAHAMPLTDPIAKKTSPRAIYAETFYPRLHFGWSDLHSLIDGNHHFIRAPMPELYDLNADPRERSNVLEQNRRIHVRMRSAIEPFIRQASAPANIDPEEAKKLAALGYVGSTVATTSGEELPDPKTTIDDFRQIRVAFTYFKNEQNEEALAIIDNLLTKNGRITDLWDLKSQVLSRLGRVPEAIEAAKSGLKQSPTAIALLFSVANLSISAGRLDEAQEHAELGLKLEPGRAHEILARIWAERGDYARAEREANLALETHHDKIAPLITLGLIAKEKGELQAALRHLDRASEEVSRKKNQRIPNVHLYRGDVLARLGRNREAEAELRREIAYFPKQQEAYSSLILLLAAEGRLEEATKLVFDLVAAAPVPRSYITVSETLKAIGDDRGAVYWAAQGVQKFPQNGDLRKLLRVARQG